MNKKEIVKTYVDKIQNKWYEIVETRYLCYESNTELANTIIYDLFGKDCFNETLTYYKYNKDEKGYTIEILCEIEKNIYFKFDIISKYGIDIPQRIRNGEFKLLKQVPNNWQNIWELWEKEEDESEVQ